MYIKYFLCNPMLYLTIHDTYFLKIKDMKFKIFFIIIFTFI